MKVSYCTRPEDVVEFNVWHALRSRTLRAMVGLALVATAAMLVHALWLIAAQEGELSAISVAVTVVPPVLFLALFLLSFRSLLRLALRFSFGEGRNAAMLGERTLELGDAGILERSESAETLTRWSAVERVGSNGAFVYVYTGAWSAHLVPRAAFASEAERDRFVAMVEQRVRDARAATGT